MIFSIRVVLCIRNFFFFLQTNEKFIKLMEGLCFDILRGKFLGEVTEIKDAFSYGSSVLEAATRTCERMHFNVMIFFSLREE